MTKAGIFYDLLGVISLFVIAVVAIFAGNVFLHELGHYAVAGSFGLHPHMELGNLNEMLTFSVESKAVASTSFISPNSAAKTALIAAFGPLMNLMLFAIFMMAMALTKKRMIVKKLFLLGVVVSAVCFLSNIIPISGSDGSLMLKLISGN